jgi:hypothetical protein
MIDLQISLPLVFRKWIFFAKTQKTLSEKGAKEWKKDYLHQNP